MPGNSLWHIRIHQSVASRHVWRVAGNDIKRSCRKQLIGLPDISFHNGNLFFQMIQRHAPPCHVRAFRLNLQPCKMLPRRLGCQQNGDNACSCSNVQNLFPFFYLCKPGQQHRIHAKAEFFFILDDLKSISVQIIQTFSFF